MIQPFSDHTDQQEIFKAAPQSFLHGINRIRIVLLAGKDDRFDIQMRIFVRVKIPDDQIRICLQRFPVRKTAVAKHEKIVDPESASDQRSISDIRTADYDTSFHSVFSITELLNLIRRLSYYSIAQMKSPTFLFKEMIHTPNKDETPLYYYSAAHARQQDELEQYRASLRANEECKQDIENAISKNFDGFRLGKAAVTEILDKHIPERIQMILASTVQIKDRDGRFSSANKDWAYSVKTPEIVITDTYDSRDKYVLSTHPAILEGFITAMRQEIRERERPSVKEAPTMPTSKITKPSKGKEPER